MSGGSVTPDLFWPYRSVLNALLPKATQGREDLLPH
jgi:hypothetical protein